MRKAEFIGPCKHRGRSNDDLDPMTEVPDTHARFCEIRAMMIPSPHWGSNGGVPGEILGRTPLAYQSNFPDAYHFPREQQ